MYLWYKLSMEINILAISWQTSPQTQSWQTYPPPQTGGLVDLIKFLGGLASPQMSGVGDIFAAPFSIIHRVKFSWHPFYRSGMRPFRASFFGQLSKISQYLLAHGIGTCLFTIFGLYFRCVFSGFLIFVAHLIQKHRFCQNAHCAHARAWCLRFRQSVCSSFSIYVFPCALGLHL